MSGRQKYIVVERWGDFQHYKDRDPKWIKNYIRLLRDDAYLELTGHQRAVLHGIWLLYASSDAQLRLDTRSLTRQLGLRVSSQHLKVLRQAGYISFSASKTGAKPEPRVREREKPKGLSVVSYDANGLGSFRIPETIASKETH